MSQQASGPLVTLVRQYLQFLCCGAGSPLSLVWAAVLPVDGLLLPGLRGCGPLRVSPFPRPSSRQQPIVRISRLVCT